MGELQSQIRWPLDLFLHLRGQGPKIPLFKYIKEKMEMGLVGNCYVQMTRLSHERCTLELELVRLKIWERILKPGILNYAEILEWEGSPAAPVDKYNHLTISVRVQNEKRRRLLFGAA